MSYSFSQLNNIIDKQYTKKESTDNWFLEETLKFGKGYSKPTDYLNKIATKIGETSKPLKTTTDIDEPLYLHI
jgi:hypothetical protein